MAVDVAAAVTDRERKLVIAVVAVLTIGAAFFRFIMYAIAINVYIGDLRVCSMMCTELANKSLDTHRIESILSQCSSSKFFLGSRAVPKIDSIFTTNFWER